MAALFFFFCFVSATAKLFYSGLSTAPVVLGGLWSDFLNRNHLSEAKWWQRDVIAVVRG